MAAVCFAQSKHEVMAAGIPLWEDQGGIVAMEIESTQTPVEAWLYYDADKDEYRGWELRLPGDSNFNTAYNTSIDYELYGEDPAPEVDFGSSYTGSGYLEFEGNSRSGGDPRAPLAFTFRINEGGVYYFWLHCNKTWFWANNDLEWRKDFSNDAYIRVEGDYEAVNPDPNDVPNNNGAYNEAYDGWDAPLDALQADNKFFGGATTNFSWSKGESAKLEVHNGGKRNAAYRFKSGETYTLYISGRSKDFKINRMAFVREDLVFGVYDENGNVITEPVTGGNVKSTDETIIEEPIVETPEAVEIKGDLHPWHKVTLELTGPESDEFATPNPFADYRFDVEFTHVTSGRTYRVPGHFAADGNAADTGATAGDKWHAHFSPDASGQWAYTISFREGTDVAVSSEAEPGTAYAGLDGLSGSMHITDADLRNYSERDFRTKGRLQYVGGHFLQFAETGEYFIKAGTDTPENLFAYDDFDDTPNAKGRTRSWEAHETDYNADTDQTYTWSSDGVNIKGTGMIGALNYLSDIEGLNSFSFLTFALDGDGLDVFPHLLVYGVDAYEAFEAVVEEDRKMETTGHWASGTIYKDRFDVSKMSQWGRIMDYATTKGLFMDIKTSEKENDIKMDGGFLERERILYYRELIARYGHNLGLNWNLGEENNLFEEALISDGAGGTVLDEKNTLLKSHAQYFHENDPYNHLVVVHTAASKKEHVYGHLIGEPDSNDPEAIGSYLTGASMQGNDIYYDDVYDDVDEWVTRSAEAGRPWVVFLDEPGHGKTGVLTDELNLTDYSQADDETLPAGFNSLGHYEHARKNFIWGTMMAGGAGINVYTGYKGGADDDLRAENFRARDRFWDYCRYMLGFFDQAMLPIQEMAPDNALLNTDDWCLAKDDEAYVIYLKNGGSVDLDLSAATGEFAVRWYDPRNGGEFQSTAVASVLGGSVVSLGEAPDSTDQDWVVLISKAIAGIPLAHSLIITQPIDGSRFNWGDEFLIEADTGETPEVLRVGFYYTNDDGRRFMKNESEYPYNRTIDTVADLPGPGTYELSAKLVYEDGSVYTDFFSDTITITVEEPAISIAAPLDGASIRVDADFTFTAMVGGTKGVKHVGVYSQYGWLMDIESDGEYSVVLNAAQYFPGPGDYELHARLVYEDAVGLDPVDSPPITISIFDDSGSASLDSDGDGVSNLIEFAAGSDPLTSGHGRSPFNVNLVLNENQHSFTFTRRKGAGSGDLVVGYELDGIRYTLQMSEDFVNWYEGYEYFSAAETIVESDQTSETVNVGLKSEDMPEVFIRVVVEQLN